MSKFYIIEKSLFVVVIDSMLLKTCGLVLESFFGWPLNHFWITRVSSSSSSSLALVNEQMVSKSTPERPWNEQMVSTSRCGRCCRGRGRGRFDRFCRGHGRRLVDVVDVVDVVEVVVVVVGRCGRCCRGSGRRVVDVIDRRGNNLNPPSNGI